MVKKLLFIALFSAALHAQPTITLATYNLLNYSSDAAREGYYRTIINEINPDLLVTQEILGHTGANNFLNNVLNYGAIDYSLGNFNDGPDTDNAIFYKASLFDFISNTPISTALRDINEFKVVYLPANDTLIIYSVHLKASQGSTNEQQRLAEINILRQITDNLPATADYIVCGDFNIYHSDEAAYQKLLEQSSLGYVLDPVDMPGTWHNDIAFAPFHSQSTRTRQFGGGAPGGLDDRFDMILVSQAVNDAGGITYVANSYHPFGNDGNHFNDSINEMPNTAVTQNVANALHNASDHIPVLIKLNFGICGLLGDVNVDSAVNSTDGLIILSFDASLPLPLPFLESINSSFGDVNGDGMTNSTDALIVLSFDVGIIISFPVGEIFCP